MSTNSSFFSSDFSFSVEGSSLNKPSASKKRTFDSRAESVRELFGANHLNLDLEMEKPTKPTKDPFATETSPFLEHGLEGFSLPCFVAPTKNPKSMENVIKQIEIFKSANSELQEKLNRAVKELNDLRESKKRKKVNSNPTWHSFLPQKDFALSVWRNSIEEESGKQEAFLEEYNHQFANLLGYDKEALSKIQFTLDKLIPDYEIADLQKGGQFFIQTCNGNKSVTITVDNGVRENCFLLRICEEPI